jgi:hypothetical protein
VYKVLLNILDCFFFVDFVFTGVLVHMFFVLMVLFILCGNPVPDTEGDMTILGIFPLCMRPSIEKRTLMLSQWCQWRIAPSLD